MIVRRPGQGEREELEEAELDVEVGLVGDTWNVRPSKRTEDGSPHPDMQLTLMSARVIELIAGDRDRWALAGDQLYVDMDLSTDNLPVGMRLSLGAATIAITDQPHTGCKKFVERFGADAHKLVNSERGRALRLRGVNARVVAGGTIRVGNVATKS